MTVSRGVESTMLRLGTQAQAMAACGWENNTKKLEMVFLEQLRAKTTQSCTP
jgi:hypothetical protein